MKTINKKGLVNSLQVIVVFLFTFSVMSIIALTIWNQTENTVNNIDNETLTPQQKADFLIAGQIFFGWPDKIFTALFVVLFIGFLISSVTIPPEQPAYLLMYFGVLIIISLFSMVLSNGWQFITETPILVEAALELPFTNFFMKFLPIITFLVGLIGAVLFYTKGRFTGSGGDPYNVQFADEIGGDSLE